VAAGGAHRGNIDCTSGGGGGGAALYPAAPENVAVVYKRDLPGVVRALEQAVPTEPAAILTVHAETICELLHQSMAHGALSLHHGFCHKTPRCVCSAYTIFEPSVSCTIRIWR
jgi:hypothetical protein